MQDQAATRIDHLNSALMLVSCVAAFVIPFELFLLAYAILGPLHYLTEISWIHDRGYFVGHEDAAERRRAKLAWLGLVGVTLAVMIYGVVGEQILHRPSSPLFEIGLFYLVFVAAALLIFRARPPVAAIAIALTALGIALLSRSPLYGLIAFLIITIIHVLVFTFAFVTLGAIRAKRASAWWSLAIYALCVLAFFLFPPDIADPASDYVRASYAPFELLNAKLIGALGLGDGNRLSEVYQSNEGVTVMRLIAFAYTYHYLNWFTKTSVIGWHRISRPRAVVIALLWIGALALYWESYTLGFVVLYSLSVLHVMLELPLNHRSFAAIGRALAGRNPPPGDPSPAT
ncbi:hypothetical protein [Sphingomonas sp.]|uniref:hypothetical protein n=1 Tax=Sphingomonas sp. TaxID=28214 RepID=UPI001B2046B2|nr:hypothetical protein [Sphingomonas sp.]MBO9711519.1 hypothetical protein [Sphingomonas sp.]